MFLANVPEAKIESLACSFGCIGPGASLKQVMMWWLVPVLRLAVWESLQARLSAPKLSGGKHDLKIRVSGCHNGCAQPETGDIGIYGEGKRMHGKLVPHYQMYFGGQWHGARSAGDQRPIDSLGAHRRRQWSE